MSLSDHDRRVLAELEGQFAAADASRSRRSMASAAVRRRLGVLTGIVGSVLLVVCLLLGVISGVLVGVLLLTSWIVAPLRRRLWETEKRADDGQL